MQARLLGGDVRVEGRGRYAGTAPADLNFRAQGVATAEGLRAAREVDDALLLRRLRAELGESVAPLGGVGRHGCGMDSLGCVAGWRWRYSFGWFNRRWLGALASRGF